MCCFVSPWKHKQVIDYTRVLFLNLKADFVCNALWFYLSTVIWRFVVKRRLAVWVELLEVAPDSEEETEMHASDETLWQSEICIQEGVRLRVT